MDFMNRGAQTPQQAATHAAPTAPDSLKLAKKSNTSGKSPKLVVVWVVALLVLGLVIAAVAVMAMKSGESKEMSLVDKGTWQAVDIAVGGANGGDQIYFGKITNITSDYLTLEKVYYIPANQTNSGTITLSQLVCQLDKPQDRMVVNREQLVYWENLQKDGKVVTTISDYQKANPNGPNCDAQPNSTPSSNSGANNQTTNNSTTPTTNTNTNTNATTNNRTNNP
jgi:hypothetical protein